MKFACSLKTDLVRLFPNMAPSTWRKTATKNVVVSSPVHPSGNITGKNNGFPILDILGYLKNTHKNPKFGRVRQIPIWELGWEFPDWDLSHLTKFGIQKWESVIFSCVPGTLLIIINVKQHSNQSGRISLQDIGMLLIPGTGNREQESENQCTAVTRLRNQNGGQEKRKGFGLT